MSILAPAPPSTSAATPSARANRPIRLRAAGAAGERRWSTELTALGDTVVTLPGRLARRRGAPVEELVVGPAGIFVVAVRTVARPGRAAGMRLTRPDISARDRDDLLATLAIRIAVVRATLISSTEFAATPIIALVGLADGEFVQPGIETIGGVGIDGLSGVGRRLSTPGGLDASARARLAVRLDERLPGPRSRLAFVVDQKPGKTGRSWPRSSAPVIPAGVCSGSRRP